MFRMFSALLVAVMVTLSSPALANLTTDAIARAGFDKLSEQQKAELIKQVTAQAANDAHVAVSTPQKVGEWVDLGTKIGQMMGGAAKELGVQVNEFAKTPVGQWTLALIVWKFAGSAIVHVVGGLLIMIVGFSFILFIARRYTRGSVVYDPSKRDYFGRSVKISEERKMWSDGDTLMFAFYGAVVTGVSLFTMFTF